MFFSQMVNGFQVLFGSVKSYAGSVKSYAQICFGIW